MASTDKYITPLEMKSIIAICEALDVVWKVVDKANVSLPLMEDEQGFHQTLPVYDSNGDVLGRIGFTEDGFGLYLDDGQGDG